MGVAAAGYPGEASLRNVNAAPAPATTISARRVTAPATAQAIYSGRAGIASSEGRGGGQGTSGLAARAAEGGGGPLRAGLRGWGHSFASFRCLEG